MDPYFKKQAPAALLICSMFSQMYHNTETEQYYSVLVAKQKGAIKTNEGFYYNYCKWLELSACFLPAEKNPLVSEDFLSVTGYNWHI